MSKTQEQIDAERDELFDELFDALDKSNKRGIEYLKIIEVYYKRIIFSEDIIDARRWAAQMIDHALKVKD